MTLQSKIFSFRNIAFALFLLASINGQAQDAHFSQFYSSPLTLNPALAGTSAGNYRVGVIYRDQWRSAVDNSLRTFSAAGDIKFYLNDRQARPDIASGGFMFYSDQVGDFDLNTNQIALIGAFHKSLSQKFDNYLGVGLQMGIHQKSINYEDLFFQDQFNAIDDFNLPTGELLPANNYAFLDFVVGLNYTVSPEKGRKYYAGASYAHLTSPNVSFYRIDNTPNPDLVRRNALFANQGPHTEVNLGNNFKYKFVNTETKYIHFGPWLRLVDNEQGFGVESIVFSAGYEVKNMIIGISYDHNISDLVAERKGLNAFELSITYLGEVDNNDGFCPTF